MEVEFRYWIALYYVNPNPPSESSNGSSKPVLSVLRGGRSLTHRFRKVDRRGDGVVELNYDNDE